MLRVYTLSNCDTCRRATKWLRARGVEFEERAIRETPPSVAELQRALAGRGGDVRKLFNTAGREYRALNIGEKLARMSEPEALALLAGNGSLVKRPFAVGEHVTLVGFDEEAWGKSL